MSPEEELAQDAGRAVLREFNNLLVAIMGNTSLALREMAHDAAARHHVENIETASRRAARLVVDMHAYLGSDRPEDPSDGPGGVEEDQEDREARDLREVRDVQDVQEIQDVQAAACASGADAPDGDLVMVVDDDPSIRTLLEHMLDAIGQSAICASCGEEALGIQRELGARISMALVDLSMPGMNGEQVYRALRQAMPGLRVVMMSGYGENASLDFLEAGPGDFLHKPFTLSDLREHVRPRGRTCRKE